MSSVVIGAVALVVVIGAVGVGVSLLNKDNPVGSDVSSLAAPAAPSIKPNPDASSRTGTGSGGTIAPTSSPAATSSAGKPASGSSSAASVAGSSGSSAPATEKFDAASMGDSGFANIPNYKKINADVKAWLKIPGTNINYPVLYDSRILNDPAVPHYYLNKDIYKQVSKNGVIYADPAVHFGTGQEISKNTVLFGHNWSNVSANPRIGSASDVMFAQLTAFHHLSFAQKHPYLYYSTEAEEMSWVVFAAFYTDVSFNYITANPDSAGLTAIINGAKARSRHNYDVAVTANDKILTLSTCTRAYGKSDRQRFVVMARLMRSDEQFKDVTITANPKPVLPKL